jgi:3-oxoacyl-[acyl-carrier protein] reductase
LPSLPAHRGALEPASLWSLLDGEHMCEESCSNDELAQIASQFTVLTIVAQVLLTFASPGSEDQVDKLVQSISEISNGSSAHKFRADLRDPESPPKIVGATLSAFRTKTIDILVNNAGDQVAKTLANVTLQDFASVYDLNVRGTLLMTQAVLPYLRSPGRIINMSSVGARAGFASLSLYCSSKAAIEGLTRSWAAELGKDKHTVNCVNPGPVQTDLLNGIPNEIISMQKAATPIENRLGTVQDIADIVGFLAEEKSRWITGQVISASGGWAMY